VEVRGAVAEGHVVDLERPEVALDGGADPQYLAVVLGRFGFGEVVRLDHVAAAPDDHGVSAHQGPPGQVRVSDGPAWMRRPMRFSAGRPSSQKRQTVPATCSRQFSGQVTMP